MLKNLHQSPEIHGNGTQNGYQRNYYGQYQKPSQQQSQQQQQAPEHSQKLSPYLFQNHAALYLELYWKQETVADINFWCFIKLDHSAFQWKKNTIFWLTRSEVNERLQLTITCGWHTLAIWIRYWTVKKKALSPKFKLSSYSKDVEYLK